MTDEPRQTTPKPFIFVLMPLAQEFNDVYTFGIKGAAEDVGAYAERLIDQVFQEGMLERIFNQINKADVLVADMTGRNANVFYEVGYAHALGKIVLLLAREVDDIPFDLKHRQFILYGESIVSLRKELRGRLEWAMEESKKRIGPFTAEKFAVLAPKVEIPEKGAPGATPMVSIEAYPPVGSFLLPLTIRNESPTESPSVQYIYLFTDSSDDIIPSMPTVGHLPWMVPSQADASEGFAHLYRLPTELQNLPHGASDQIVIYGQLRTGMTDASGMMKLRIHTSTRVHDFPFQISVSVAAR
jgi:hypothetical protein